jgi:hypothetical protein
MAPRVKRSRKRSLKRLRGGRSARAAKSKTAPKNTASLKKKGVVKPVLKRATSLKNTPSKKPVEFGDASDMNEKNVVLFYRIGCPFCDQFMPLFHSMTKEFAPLLPPTHSILQVGPDKMDDFAKTEMGSIVPPVDGVPTMYVLGKDGAAKFEDRDEASLRRLFSDFARS